MADDTFDADVLRLLDAVLQQPATQRSAWLRAQTVADSVRTRVQEILSRQDTLANFLETPAPAMPAGELVAGLRLGAWSLVRPLDAGGMGVVWLARRADGAYEQPAAIKFVRIDAALGAAARAALLARFDTERRLLARLDHRNIARVIDGGSTPAGVPWLAMEFVDGQPLAAWCEAQGLDVRARVALMRRVCDGVHAAHRHLVVHGDLKPANILIDAAGEPRLLDFGIARTLDPGDGTHTVTQLHAMTPAYASPEQMRLEPLTTASDVYSLGVVLYELATGVRPYSLEGLSPAQSERVVCDTDPAPLRRAAAVRPAGAIGADLERIVAKAMHKDPARRYDTAQALADDLQRYLERRPVLAHPDSFGYRAARFLRRHRLASAAAAIASLALLAAAGIAWQQAQRAGRAAQDTAQVNAFLLDVLNVSSPYAAGSELTLGEALDEASAKVDERFGGRPDLSVAIRTALGESQFARYRLEQAEKQLRLARSDAERAFGPDDARSVQALSSLASVLKERDETTAEARELFVEAVARLERSGQTGTPLHAAVLNDLGVMHLVAEQPAQALGYLEKAATIDAGDDRAAQEERARTLANLAQAARGSGDLDRADALYRQAQPVLEALYPEGGPHLAVILNNRARLAWVRGHEDEALALQLEAVAMHRRSFKGDHVMVLVPMTNLARMALDRGDVDLAATWAPEALAMADRLYAEAPHAYLVNALAAVVAVGLAQERFDEVAAPAARMRRVLAALDEPPASTRDFAAQLLETLCARADRPAAACP